MSNETQAPVKTLRHGTLQVSIWKNVYDGKAVYNARLVQRYKDKASDEWKDSKYINDRDLPAASVLIVRASNWIAHLSLIHI